MLQKYAIMNIEQFDKSAKDAQSIVIYGSRKLGRLTVDHLIETGNRDKIAAIVHTKGSKDYPQAYRHIPIQEAAAFFARSEHKDALVIVCVGPHYLNEIFEALESYGVQICAYLNQMELALINGDARPSDIRSFIFTEGQLCDLVDKANKVVIYATGEHGDSLTNYLQRVGRGSKIQENIRLIQEAPGKYSVAASPADSVAEDVLVLVAPDYRKERNIFYTYVAIREIKGLDFKNCYICTFGLMERLFVLLKNKSQGEGIQDIQFVVAGFGKCGTTSLHFALKKIEDISLPDVKEPHLFDQEKPVSDPKEKLLRRFYSHVPKGSVSGYIDPTLVFFPKEIRETFGPDLRVCFLMRNPVGATYSSFKMCNRRGDNPSWFRYDRYGTYCKEMLDDCITALQEERGSYYEYANILEEFLQYYPMKRIKVVIFEELIREPGEKINEFLRFVGSKGVYDPKLGLPKKNSGDFVWTDQEGMMLGMRQTMLRRERKKYLNWRIPDDSETALARANEIQNEMFRLEEKMYAAEKIYNPEMTPQQRKRLEDFYRPSVRKLEKLLGRDLSKLWFE